MFNFQNKKNKEVIRWDLKSPSCLKISEAEEYLFFYSSLLFIEILPFNLFNFWHAKHGKSKNID